MKVIYLLIAIITFILPIQLHANPAEHQQRKIRIYMASALFNGRETQFNLEMAKQFEKRNYQTLLPQRDGFEYKALQNTMGKSVARNELVDMTRELIYLLDMGVFIPQSDVVVANLDEPLDEGVVVELTYAHMIGKPVIGYRTDSRTPFGGVDGLGGLHSFVGYQCDTLIRQRISYDSLDASDKTISDLADSIDKTIKKYPLNDSLQLPAYAQNNPAIANILQAAHYVFQDVHGLHTEKGLKQAVSNMQKHRAAITRLATSVKVINKNSIA